MKFPNPFMPPLFMGYTNDWDENVPADHTKFKTQPGHVRDAKLNVAERLKNFFYGFTTGETNEGAKKIKMIVQATPSTAADSVILYAKDVSATAEWFILDEAANDIQITSGGKIKGDNALWPNDTYILAKDSTGTGTIDLIKANASNKPVLSDGAEMATSGAPTVDAGIANKKYIDDAIAALTQETSDQVVGTSDITCNSANYKDMDDMTLSLTGPGKYFFFFNASIYIPQASGGSVKIALDIDGVDVHEQYFGGYSISAENPQGHQGCFLVWRVVITTESTAKIQWKDPVGTAYQKANTNGSPRVFSFKKTA